MKIKETTQMLLQALEADQGNVWKIARILEDLAQEQKDKRIAHEMLRIAANGGRPASAVMNCALTLYTLAPEQTRNFLLATMRDGSQDMRYKALGAIGAIVFCVHDEELVKVALDVSSRDSGEFHALLSSFAFPFPTVNQDGRIALIIERALSCTGEEIKENALRIAAKTGICNSAIEKAVLECVAQGTLSYRVLSAASELRIHIKHPHLFLHLDDSLIHDNFALSVYVYILCDLDEMHQKARKRLHEIAKRRYWDRDYILAVVLKREKMDDVLWSLLWETVSSPKYECWTSPLADTIADMMHGNNDVASRIMNALTQEGRISGFAAMVVEKYVSREIQQAAKVPEE